MKLISFICLLGVTLFVEVYSDEWESFKVEFGKQYMPSEESKRKSNFLEWNSKIKDHNEKFEQGLKSYRLKMNTRGDMNFAEIVGYAMGLKTKKSVRGDVYNYSIEDTLPKSVDWRTKGAVTPVKDQGICGASWAFSATGSMEGQLWKKNGELVSLSEQNLIDCSWMQHNCGCKSSGATANAFMYIKENNGIDTESSYPYDNGKIAFPEYECRYQAEYNAGHNIGFEEIPKGDELALQSAVANIGPISVGINASTFEFLFYSDGIFNEPSCNSDDSDHAALVVGYGTEDGNDYWIVKNSWGTTWGDNGYIKMSRNLNNQCRIASHALYPVV